jgi:hypothetical protein
MKKLLLAILFVSMTASAQQFGQSEYFTASIYVDPAGSVKENGINLGSEIELVNYGMYVKAGFQSFDALTGGYMDLTGAGGVNVTWGIFEEVRTYAGIRLGFIKRGYKVNDPQTYPLFGLEGGVDYSVTDNFFVGLRSTYDYREDFIWSGSNEEYQFSGFVRAGFKF